MKANALILKDGKLERAEITTLKHMQDAVEGYIETAFRLPGEDPSRPHLAIDVYVNEEGLYKFDDWHFAVGGDVVQGGYAFRGPAVIVGSDESTGEQRDLTEREMQAFSVSAPDMVGVQGVMMYLPVLMYTQPEPLKDSLV